MGTPIRYTSKAPTMTPLRFMGRASPRTVAFARPLFPTSVSRFPYKDSQDRESLRPRAQEGSRSTSDDDVANNPDAAFNPHKTRPETEMKAAEEGRGDDASPLEASGANQSFNKPRGDEKSPNDRGLGKEVRKGGTSEAPARPRKVTWGTERNMSGPKHYSLYFINCIDTRRDYLSLVRMSYSGW